MTLNHDSYFSSKFIASQELYPFYLSSDVIGTYGSTIIVCPTKISSLKVVNSIHLGKPYNLSKIPEMLNQTDNFPPELRTDIFSQVKSKIEDISNQDVKSASIRIIEILEKCISPFSNIDLPNFYSFIREDGSYLIEWNFTHYKVGISIEINVSESSWYFVSDEDFGYLYASGEILNNKIKAILEWLMPFVISKRGD